jgi:hypothetical protein
MQSESCNAFHSAGCKTANSVYVNIGDQNKKARQCQRSAICFLCWGVVMVMLMECLQAKEIYG